MINKTNMLKQENSGGKKFESQEMNTAEASLKVDPTILTKAQPRDIHKQYDSEGMCVEE